MAAQADCVAIITNHTVMPYDGILERARVIADTRNAYRADRLRQRSSACR